MQHCAKISQNNSFDFSCQKLPNCKSNNWRENSNSKWDGFFCIFLRLFHIFSSFQLSRCSLVVAQLHKIICSGDSQWCQNPKRTGVPDFSPRWFGTSCTWTMCAITWRCHSGGFAKTFSRPKIPGKKRGKKLVLIWIFALKISKLARKFKYWNFSCGIPRLLFWAQKNLEFDNFRRENSNFL